MSKFTFITILLTYTLIVFGGYVASSESGMGCGPDWPLCNGAVIPQLEGATLIEFGHRVIGAALFVLVLILFAKIRRRDRSNLETKVACWMIGLLTMQLIMGAIVVFYHLPSLIITVHLLIAMVFMALLIWFWRQDRPDDYQKSGTEPRLKNHFNQVIGLVFITIGLGAYIKHQHYGSACGWLSCGEDSFLPVTIPEILQTSHRFLAFVVTLYILFLTYKVFKENIKPITYRMLIASTLIIIQIGAGIITILTFIPITMAVLHLAIGTLLFGVLVETKFKLN
ncbi:COX15/CtaA family protein [Virgibacillus doumboii]|uniref:COX15/CtaA family protein n=1 Tax=Virgibacillus doumboii TaxID=2697503 RepID=UPI0013DF061F|nr:COX15/CtaA family protein [Virgibacillus doumboii]